MKIYDALYIAEKVINRTDIEQGDSITNLKLQKLLYYLQGFWLAIYDQPLFDEPIEAWIYGPVVPRVYHHYRGYGKNALPVSNENPYGITNPLETKEEEELFDEIYTLYNQYSSTALVNMTHSETPWAITSSQGLKTEIGRNVMKSFFLTKVE